MQWVLYHSAAPFGETPYEFQKKLQSGIRISRFNRIFSMPRVCFKNVAIQRVRTFDESLQNTIK